MGSNLLWPIFITDKYPMQTFESILAFGDSNVAGAEAVPQLAQHYDAMVRGHITMEDVDAISKPYSFANCLAARLGIPCHNFAMSGGSNPRSLRLLTQHIRQHPRSLVLFGYTSTDRMEFYYPDPGVFYARDSDQFIQTGMQWHHRRTNLTDLTASTMPAISGWPPHPINDMVVEKILRPHNNLWEVMTCVDAVCHRWGSRVLHLPLFPEQIPTAIDSVFDFEGQGHWIRWCKWKKFVPTARWHFEHTAHDQLSQLLFEHLAQ